MTMGRGRGEHAGRLDLRLSRPSEKAKKKESGPKVKRKKRFGLGFLENFGPEQVFTFL